MIILQAPHEIIQTTTLLPDPEFHDEENRQVVMNLQYAMDGTSFTNIKSNDRIKLVYDFNLTRFKSLELFAFIDAYFDYNIRLTNWKNEVWVVNIVNNPQDFVAIAFKEINTIRLEFEGELLGGPNSYSECPEFH